VSQCQTSAVAFATGAQLFLTFTIVNANVSGTPGFPAAMSRR
jgi:hypothetical protein